MKARPFFYHNSIVFFLAAFFSISHPVAHAWNDEVSKACVQQGLAATAAETAICHAYIEGFLDGAVITDTAIIASVTAEEVADSEYLQRAYKTRVGSYNPKLPATALAQFCLPSGKERSEIVTTIATAIGEDKDAAKDISISLYSILKSYYPCEKS